MEAHVLQLWEIPFYDFIDNFISLDYFSCSSANSVMWKQDLLLFSYLFCCIQGLTFYLVFLWSFIDFFPSHFIDFLYSVHGDDDDEDDHDDDDGILF